MRCLLSGSPSTISRAFIVAETIDQYLNQIDSKEMKKRPKVDVHHFNLLDKLKESITTHCLNAAEKIRTDKQTTRAVTVFIRTSPFDKNRKYYSNSITIELPVDTNNSLELVKTAINGLNKIYKYGYFYQKAGIILSKLKNSSEKELNLLTPILENKSKTLMKAIDFTNAKYGRNAISIAQAGINNDWKMRREHSSKIDTASFDSLPKISI